jgi:tRNA1(Val) A37 N6-methylase TrmN6
MAPSLPEQAPETTEDRLLGGRLVLRQPKDGFRVAIDTVVLAAAVPAKPGERVFEPGAGVGGAALCLAARVDGVRVAGIEPQPALVRLAGENVRLNGMQGAVDIMAGAIGRPLPPRVAGPFDHIMANPPFLEPSRTQAPQDESRAAAHVEGDAALDAWCRCAHDVLKRGGTLTLIHRADRLDAVLAALGHGFGGVTVFPLWPRAGQPARRILVRAAKGSNAPLILAAGLVLHGEGNGYTAEADAALRGGALAF